MPTVEDLLLAKGGLRIPTSAGAGKLAQSDALGNLIWATYDVGSTVKAFGALGDGSTDDTAAIQAAVSSVSPGGTLFFPRGTYMVQPTQAGGVALPDNICIKGERGTIIKSLTATAHKDRMFLVTGHVLVLDITLQVSNAVTPRLRAFHLAEAATHLKCANVTFLGLGTAIEYKAPGGSNADLTLINCEFDGQHRALVGIGTADEAIGVYFGGSGTCIVSGCRFRRLGTNNTSKPYSSHSLYLERGSTALIENCRFEDHVDGRLIQFYPDTANTSRFTVIRDCYFGPQTIVGGDACQTNPGSWTVFENCIFACANAVAVHGDTRLTGCRFKYTGAVDKPVQAYQFETFPPWTLIVEGSIFEGDGQRDIGFNQPPVGISFFCRDTIFRSGALVHIWVENVANTLVSGYIRNCHFLGAETTSAIEWKNGALDVQMCRFANLGRGIYNWAATLSQLVVRNNEFAQTGVAVQHATTPTVLAKSDNIGYT